MVPEWPMWTGITNIKELSMAPASFRGASPPNPPKIVWVIISPPGVSPPCFEMHDLLVTGYCKTIMHTVMLLSSFFTDSRALLMSAMRAPCMHY